MRSTNPKFIVYGKLTERIAIVFFSLMLFYLLALEIFLMTYEITTISCRQFNRASFFRELDKKQCTHINFWKTKECLDLYACGASRM